MRMPIRKAGKYSGLKADPNITAAKHKELKEKLERLKAISRPRAITELKLHASDGDFSDNAAYSAAKGRLRGINRRIEEIEEHLKRAVIIGAGGSSGVAALGSYVTLEVNGRKKAYYILGSSEADPTHGVISHSSPLGQALLGRRVGDIVRVQLAERAVEYRIVKIE